MNKKSSEPLPKGYQLKHTPEVGWWVDGRLGYRVSGYCGSKEAAITAAITAIKEVEGGDFHPPAWYLQPAWYINNKGTPMTSKLTDAQKALQKAETLLAKKQEALANERLKMTPLEEEVRELQKQVREAKGEALLANIPSLLAVVTDHVSPYRGDLCNDRSQGNAGTCPRCTLLYLQESPYEVANYEFVVEVRKA
jgi:hypothetical protein